jgi:hypothetical protein
MLTACTTIEETIRQLERMVELATKLARHYHRSSPIAATIPLRTFALKTDFARLRRHINLLLILLPQPTALTTFLTTFISEEDPEGG